MIVIISGTLILWRITECGRVGEGPEHIPVDTWREAGYRLDKVITGPQTENNSHSHSFPVHLNCMFLEFERNTDYLEGTHEDTRTTFRFHAESPRSGRYEPTTSRIHAAQRPSGIPLCHFFRNVSIIVETFQSGGLTDQHCSAEPCPQHEYNTVSSWAARLKPHRSQDEMMKMT